MAPDGHVRDVEAADQPAAAQHPLGPEGQLPGRADRLSAARRAARLDRRRAGLLAHGRVQHGRRRLLHEVAEGRRARISTRAAACRTSSPTCSAVPTASPRAARPRGRDVAVIIPWNMYLVYGDARCSSSSIRAWRSWVEFERTRAGDDFIWDGDSHFGDWLAFATTRSDYPGRDDRQGPDRDGVLRALDRPACTDGARARQDRRGDEVRGAAREDQGGLQPRVRDVRRDAWARTRRRRTCWPSSSTCCPRSCAPVAAARLAQEIRERGHLTTGFVGTPYLCHVLSRYGYLDEAYLLLNREDYPSWLYPVKQGATTIWERWDGQKPDGSFQDKGMNSFNHYAYGAVGDWMYRDMAGIDIDPADPGYKHLLVHPMPGGGFTSVKAAHESTVRPRGVELDARQRRVHADGGGAGRTRARRSGCLAPRRAP